MEGLIINRQNQKTAFATVNTAQSVDCCALKTSQTSTRKIVQVPAPLVIRILQTELGVADLLLQLIQADGIVQTIESQVDERELAASRPANQNSLGFPWCNSDRSVL